MGELSDIGVADLLYLLALRRQTGKLSVSSNGDEVSLYLANGQLVVVTSTNMALRLGRMLVRMGFIDADRLREALYLQEHVERGRPLGGILLDRGYVTEQQLSECVEEQCVEILARVISANTGVFVYHRDARVKASTEIIPLNADRIILEATRRTDELVTLRGLLPDPNAPLMLTASIDEVAATLSDTEVFIAASLQASASNITELTGRIGIEEVALWRTVISMRERGLIVVGDIQHDQSTAIPSLAEFNKV